MNIEFYNLETGETVPTGSYFILYGNEVWTDNEEMYESQAAQVGFEDCIRRCPNIGWRWIDM